MRRVTASEATRKRIAEMLRKVEGLDRSELVRQAARLVIEEALEAEVSEALGRGDYDRGLGGSPGQRNGYRCGKLEGAEGRIEYSVPQVRGLAGWQSEVKAALGGKTEELERLAIEMYARGLSMRDIEAAFTDNEGRCVLSRSAAGRVAEQLWVDYQAFAIRSLGDIPRVYLYVRGSRTAASWTTARSDSGGLGHSRGRDQASAGAITRHQRRHRLLSRVSARFESPSALRSYRGDHRRGAGTYPSRGRSLPQEFASAVPGPQAAEFAIEGARGALAGSDPRGPCHLPSSEPRVGANRPRGVRQKLEQRVAFGRGLF